MSDETREYKPELWSKRRRWRFMLPLLLLALSIPFSVQAHIVPEEPWHPAPASYLRSLFYANLQPVNWALIDAEYTTVSEPEFGGILDSVYQALAPISVMADYRSWGRYSGCYRRARQGTALCRVNTGHFAIDALLSA